MDLDRLHDVDWRRQQREALFDPGTIDRLERIGVAAGWRCLEVGAGYGSIAAWLADRAGPRCVTATDIDGEYLSHLHQRLGAGGTVLEHDVSAQSLPTTAFDLVHARFVLEHVPGRDAVVAKLLDALRPGGWLCIEDAEFSSCVALDSAYGDAMAAFVTAMSQTGTDYDWTRRLPEVMSRAGAVAGEASGSTRFFAGASEEAAFWASNWLDVRDRLEGVGLSDAVLEAALHEISDRDRWFPSPTVVTATGRQPAIRAGCTA